MVANPLGHAYCKIPSVLSSVTGTFGGSVHPWAAGRSQRFMRSPKQSLLTAHEDKSLGLDGQECFFPVHLPAPARGAWMSFVRIEASRRSGGSAPPPQAEDRATPPDRGGGRRYMCIVRALPTPIYASLSELVRESLFKSLPE